MILTVTSAKGGVCKTTTAVHLTHYLHQLHPLTSAILLDGDETKNATAWYRRGAEWSGREGGFLFAVKPIQAFGQMSRMHEHLVIDTGQRPSVEDLQAAIEYSDLVVIPAVPSSLDTDGLGQTLRAIEKIDGGMAKCRVLLTRVSADMAKEAAELRELLASFGAQAFVAEIPRLKAFEKAAGLGMTVDLVPDKNAARAWAAYASVGKELGL